MGRYGSEIIRANLTIPITGVRPLRRDECLSLGRRTGSEDEDAYIFIQLDDKPFVLESFVKDAPTGIESPPEPLQVGDETFYYYGAGGGGVQYDDQYFHNLKGKTLYISFAGPVRGRQIALVQEAKQMEVRILGSFRAF